MKPSNTARWAIAIAIFVVALTLGVVRAEMRIHRYREGFPLFFAPPEWHRDRLARESLPYGFAGLLLSCFFMLATLPNGNGRLRR